MAQADGNCANASGSAFRSDLNNQLAALFTTSSGATAPATTFAYQQWADTTANVLKIRNGSNTDWITLRGLDGSVTGTVNVTAGSLATPSLTFGTDGPNHGFYRSAAGVLSYKTQFNGADYQLFALGQEAGAGPSLYWGGATAATSINDNPQATNSYEGLELQKRGRVNISFNGGPCMRLNRIGTDGLSPLGSVLQFHSDGTQAGRIGILTATTVDLIDASDRRLKDNITDMPEAKTRINQIQMHRFRMISSDTYEDGFIAQELKDVYPDAVLGTETDVDEDGNPEYMGVGKATLVPLLMKGLQEAYAEIAALSARVEALEGA